MIVGSDLKINIEETKLLQPVILCGGEGKRLWPVSRPEKPKQFLKMFSGKCLFQITLERLTKISNIRCPIIITSKKSEFLVKDITKKVKLDCKIILEPEGKGTATAIYLAAKLSEKNDTLIIMPSDHYIKNNKNFMHLIQKAHKNLLLEFWYTFMVKPTFVSTEYGYIKCSTTNSNETVKDLIQFVEKPSYKVAKEMISSKKYYWNSGIFMGNVSTILNSISLHAFRISSICDQIFDTCVFDNINNTVTLNPELFSTIEAESIDFAVLEKENNIKCIELNTEWSDLGSWDSFFKHINFKKNTQNVAQIGGKNTILNLDNRILGIVGLSDLLVVDTKEATLISKKNHSNEIHKLINIFKSKNIDLPRSLSNENRPWGSYNILLEIDNYKVKKLIIDPKQSISLQYHNQRTEHWVVVSGIANVFLDGENRIMTAGNSIDIPKKSHHSVSNNEDVELIIIEVQMGDYLGEDDITRLKDKYGRI